MNKQLFGVAGVMLIIGGLSGYSIARDTSMMNRREYSVRDDRTTEIPTGMHMMHDGMMMNDDSTSTGMMNNGMMGMTMTVKSEEDFLRNMIPHHEEAVKTATEVLERGSDNTAVQALARSIVTDQTTEIKAMRTWYKTWYNKDYTADGSYKPMMRDLSKLSGTELDRVFLEDMIKHHMGALMMAKSVTPFITHPEIKTLTENILTSQSKQIDEMRVILTQ